ncbi:MAG: tetratricopeptide repeat protein [Terracidiphilus sp.]
MSLAAEERKKSDRKASWLPLSWGSLWLGIRDHWMLIALILVLASDFIDLPRWRRIIVTNVLFLGVLLLLLAVSMARRKTVLQALLGRFDQALRWNRWLCWIPGYGGSLEGWILLEAGRYSEAQAATKPLAFDKHGNPRLANWQLLYYAMALSHQGKGAEAQDLLEAALRLKPKIGRFHLGLADCLLEQGKDPETARALLEQVQANWQEESDTSGRRAKQALREARYAFALAGCAGRVEAILHMLQASAGSATFISRDRAWLRYYAGETWRALGDTEKARAAFEEASELHPYGQVGQRSQNRLLETGKPV